jgi:hypothetical protein
MSASIPFTGEAVCDRNANPVAREY